MKFLICLLILILSNATYSSCSVKITSSTVMPDELRSELEFLFTSISKISHHRGKHKVRVETGDLFFNYNTSAVYIPLNEGILETPLLGAISHEYAHFVCHDYLKQKSPKYRSLFKEAKDNDKKRLKRLKIFDKKRTELNRKIDKRGSFLDEDEDELSKIDKWFHDPQDPFNASNKRIGSLYYANISIYGEICADTIAVISQNNPEAITESLLHLNDTNVESRSYRPGLSDVDNLGKGTEVLSPHIIFQPVRAFIGNHYFEKLDNYEKRKKFLQVFLESLREEIEIDMTSPRDFDEANRSFKSRLSEKIDLGSD